MCAVVLDATERGSRQPAASDIKALPSDGPLALLAPKDEIC